MVTLRERFRKELEAAFSERGNQADFVRASGLSLVTVHRWLKNQRVPDLDQVEKAARALGRMPGEILFPDRNDLSSAWREVIRRVGPVDDSQVPAILAGIRAALAGLALDQKENLSQNSSDLTNSRKSKT